MNTNSQKKKKGPMRSKIIMLSEIASPRIGHASDGIDKRSIRLSQGFKGVKAWLQSLKKNPIDNSIIHLICSNSILTF